MRRSTNAETIFNHGLLWKKEKEKTNCSSEKGHFEHVKMMTMRYTKDSVKVTHAAVSATAVLVAIAGPLNLGFPAVDVEFSVPSVLTP